MRLAIALSALPVLALAGCGDGSSPEKETGRSGRVVTQTAKILMRDSLPPPYNDGDLENGRRIFARCRSCHTLTEGGPNMTGPNLWGVFGRPAGSNPKYNYSAAVKEAGFVWDAEHLDNWLENPRTFLQGTKMSFPGIPDPTDRRDVIAYLKVETGYTLEPQGAAQP